MIAGGLPIIGLDIWIVTSGCAQSYPIKAQKAKTNNLKQSNMQAGDRVRFSKSYLDGYMGVTPISKVKQVVMEVVRVKWGNIYVRQVGCKTTKPMHKDFIEPC